MPTALSPRVGADPVADVRWFASRVRHEKRRARLAIAAELRREGRLAARKIERAKQRQRFESRVIRRSWELLESMIEREPDYEYWDEIPAAASSADSITASMLEGGQ